MDVLVNGVARRIRSSPDTPLLWVLRDELDLTGTKYGCGTGSCGVCTVHLDGAAIPSCLLPVGEVGNAAVTTIEGLSAAGTFAELERAWLDADVSQCGYCQPGVLMTLAALLTQAPRPAEADAIKAVKVICRCGSYPAMRRALHRLFAR
jgi:isoquinoline 1-oxidoreductase subunit alpha